MIGQGNRSILTPIAICFSAVTLAFAGFVHTHLAIGASQAAAQVVSQPVLPINIAEEHPTTKNPQPSVEFQGVELLSTDQIRGHLVAHVDRFHDKSSGVEFLCIQDHGCVLTGRKW